MKAGNGHWAIVALVIFITAALGFARVKNYQLIELESAALEGKVSFDCVEQFSGTLKPKKLVDGAQLLVSLEYHIEGREEERSAVVKGERYSISVRGRPTADQTWTLRAFYFDQTGQLAETAQQFNNLACDQGIEANLEL